MDTKKARHATSALSSSIRRWAGTTGKRGLAGVLDGLYKLAIPIGTIILAYVGHNIQQSMATTQLLIQREDADTKIRAEMFKATTEPLFKGVKDMPLTPSDRAVFAQLLTLNFHEYIELKPLLLDVDTKLAADSAVLQEKIRRLPGKARERPVVLQIESRQLRDRIEELRSVARRVRSRQTAVLVGEPRSENQTKQPWWNVLSPSHAGSLAKESQGTIRFVGVRRQSVREAKDTYLDTCGVQPTEGKNIWTEELVRELAPDGKSFIVLTMREKSDFQRQRFGVGFKDQTLSASHVEPRSDDPDSKRAPEKPDAPIPKGAIIPSGATMAEFDVTWFDFPFTDNTLLASGARFAIFIDKVCQKSKDEEVDAVRLGLLWFPKDYYPARERPTNYRQLQEKLGLVMQNAH